MPELEKTGHEAFDSDWPLSGSYASHIVLRNHQQVVAVPDSLPDVAASIATCAGATVMACMEQAGSLAGKRVMVMGIGMLGLIAVEAAVRGGAAEVVAVDRNRTRLEWARELGAVTPDFQLLAPRPNQSFSISPSSSPAASLESLPASTASISGGGRRPRRQCCHFPLLMPSIRSVSSVAGAPSPVSITTSRGT